MTPDDPRHGTLAGYMAHRTAGEPTCAACQTAAADYERQRYYDSHLGRSRIIPALGTGRRIQALMAIGWSGPELTRRMGWVDRNCMRHLAHQPTCTRRVADKVAAIYDELQGTVGPSAITRKRAQAKGWPPPLAWDDIDNPDEQPAGWEYIPEDRAGAIRAMLERGDNRTQVERALGLNTHALMRWCHNNGLRDEYLTLAAREGDWNARGRYSRNYDEGAA